MQAPRSVGDERFVYSFVTEVVAGECWSKQEPPESVSFVGLFGVYGTTRAGKGLEVETLVQSYCAPCCLYLDR